VGSEETALRPSAEKRLNSRVPHSQLGFEAEAPANKSLVANCALQSCSYITASIGGAEWSSKIEI
jgi:hypothetical protein